MKELHAYENEDGTFRVAISERVEYFVGNIKQQKDALIEIPRTKFHQIFLEIIPKKILYLLWN